MGFVSGVTPHYMGGVSQQPDNIALPTQLRTMINGIIDPTYGVGKRPGTQHIGKFAVTSESAAAFVHIVDRSETEKYLMYFHGSDFKVINLLTGSAHTVTVTGSPLTYLSCTTPREEIKAVTLGDTTYLVNTTKTTALSSSTTAAVKPTALCWMRQLIPGINYTVRLRYGGTLYTGTYNVGATGTWKAADAITSLKTSLNTALGGAASAWTLTDKDSVLLVTRASDNNDFEIECIDGSTGKAMTVVKNVAQSFADLPSVAPNGYKCLVRGDLSSDQDDYWVKFTANDTTSSMASGIWEETLAPGIQYAIDATTMPVVVTRDTSTTFTIKAATWSDKSSGDASIGKTPSFIGKTLQDIFLFQNRLGFLSGNGIILSEAGNFANFWRKTALLLEDDDPIDVIPSHPRVAKLYHAVPFDQSLLIFGDESQYILSGGQTLTPRTVSINLATNYGFSKVCRPVPVGNEAYFMQPNSETSAYSGYSLLMSYRVAENTGEVKTADNLFEQCPRLFTGDAMWIAANPAQKMAVAFKRTISTSNYAAVYQWLDVGGRRVISAPHLWNFSGAQIHGAAFIGTSLYMVMKRASLTGYLTIEKLDTTYIPTGLYGTVMDQMTAVTGGTYAAGSTTTTIPVPVNSNLSVTQGYLDATYGTELTVTGSTSTTVTVTGNYAGLGLWVGRGFTASLVTPDVYVRRQSPNGEAVSDTSGRLQLSRLHLSYIESCYFTVSVEIDNGQTYTYTLPVTTGANGVAAVAGVLKIPIAAENTKHTLTISSDKPYPFWIVSGQWFGTFVPKGRPV